MNVPPAPQQPPTPRRGLDRSVLITIIVAGAVIIVAGIGFAAALILRPADGPAVAAADSTAAHVAAAEAAEPPASTPSPSPTSIASPAPSPTVLSTPQPSVATQPPAPIAQPAQPSAAPARPTSRPAAPSPTPVVCPTGSIVVRLDSLTDRLGEVDPGGLFTIWYADAVVSLTNETTSPVEIAYTSVILRSDEEDVHTSDLDVYPPNDWRDRTLPVGGSVTLTGTVAVLVQREGDGAPGAAKLPSERSWIFRSNAVTGRWPDVDTSLACETADVTTVP